MAEGLVGCFPIREYMKELHGFYIDSKLHYLSICWQWFDISMKKHVCLFFYYTDNFERHMTVSFLMSKYLKKFYSFSILFWTVWYPKYCQHHTLNVFNSLQKCANEIWHYLFARLNILRCIFCYKTNLINYDIMYIFFKEILEMRRELVFEELYF